MPARKTVTSPGLPPEQVMIGLFPAPAILPVLLRYDVCMRLTAAPGLLSGSRGNAGTGGNDV
ncbi:hypothetical protein AOE01nite_20870 [Acetobacter oeni]|uniref:Uncharacterized protein n=1 Tax=Acetobacter oeni TaxID=304077 RepID=A0A511XLP2_9PROT|nr:hypothetical protein AOE01nite_20870 [Acetobacter oeni]